MIGILDMQANNCAKQAELTVNQQGLEIIFRPRAELKLDPANPRRHSKKTGSANCGKCQDFWLQCSGSDRSRWPCDRRTWAAARLPRARHGRGANLVPRAFDAHASPRL